MPNTLINIQRPLNVCRASAGTGKTFTLAAYYVGLLLSGESYRSILAVTFTNKATAEMRERIMGYLLGISQGSEPDFLRRARDFMICRREASDEELQSVAGECFREMLLDYDNVHVQTIDAFLLQLLSGMSGVLQMSMGLNTELDIDHVIATAVDRLVTTDLTDEIEQLMTQYLNLQLDQERQWDVRAAIRQMAKELYNEAVQVLDAQGLITFDAQALEHYRNAVEQAWTQRTDIAQLRQLLASIHPDSLIDGKATEPKLLPHGGDILKAVERLQASLDQPEQQKTADLFRGLTANQYDAAQAGKWTKLPSDVVEAIVRATDLARQLRTDWFTRTLTLAFTHEMQLMSALRQIIADILDKQNSALLAQTANKLHQALMQGDADFILEKAGIRYRHVLIDEFQDTSILQWEVFKQLLNDLLAASGNTLLIVGDIKQSIYRWRNGDWHTMGQLGHDSDHYSEFYNADFPPLVRNYRSSREVVQFNLSLFRSIIENEPDATLCEQLRAIYDEGFDPNAKPGESGHIDQFCQAAKKPDGFVRFRAFPSRKRTADDLPDEAPVRTRDAMCYDMFDTMEELLSQGAMPEQMMVLVRRNDDARDIIAMHAALEPTAYPLLSQAHMVSSDSFLLEASRDVQAVIKGMQYLLNRDSVAAHFVAQVTHRPDAAERLMAIGPTVPLYETVCEIVRQLLCDDQGVYHGTETAYIDCLLDNVRTYVSHYGSHMSDFLEYWDDTLHKKAIPAPAGEAIRVMTVHSSKGLQSQTLFVPFCQWPKEIGSSHPKVWCMAQPQGEPAIGYLPIEEGKKMAESAYSNEYNTEHINQHIDNLNMLYVALTRAEDNLYISTEFALNKDGLGTNDHVGRYILDACNGMEDQLTGDNLPLTKDGAPYAEQVYGQPLIVPLRDKAGGKTFDFNGAKTQTLQLCCNSDQVRFVRSQEGLLYAEYGEEADRRAERIDKGNLCHEIFAATRHIDELPAVLDDFQTRGLIETDEQRKDIEHLINGAWRSPQMRDWFTSPWTVEREKPIYMDGHEYRPDRVMIDEQTKRAIVLDYKFGAHNEKYFSQVQTYMQAMQLLGYENVSGYLWYAYGSKLVPVPPKEPDNG